MCLEFLVGAWNLACIICARGCSGWCLLWMAGVAVALLCFQNQRTWPFNFNPTHFKISQKTPRLYLISASSSSPSSETNTQTPESCVNLGLSLFSKGRVINLHLPLFYFIFYHIYNIYICCIKWLSLILMYFLFFYSISSGNQCLAKWVVSVIWNFDFFFVHRVDFSSVSQHLICFLGNG